MNKEASFCLPTSCIEEKLGPREGKEPSQDHTMNLKWNQDHHVSLLPASPDLS